VARLSAQVEKLRQLACKLGLNCCPDQLLRSCSEKISQRVRHLISTRKINNVIRFHGGLSHSVGLLSANNKSTRYAANLQTIQTPDSVIAPRKQHMTTKSPFFSIGIPTRDRTGLLVEALGSVLDQSFSDWEIILVNDGGKMPMSPTLAHMINDPRIRLIPLEASAGRGAGRQRVIEEASGEWMLWLDDDDIFTDGALLNLSRAVENLNGSIAAFDTTTFHAQSQSWRNMAQIGFDASMFANKAKNLVIAMLQGWDASNHFENLWSKVARTELYRQIGFITDHKDPRGRTLEDIEFVIRTLEKLGEIPSISLSKPAYIFRVFGPNVRSEQSEEPELRLAASKKIHDCHNEFFSTHSDDPAYEYACQRYLMGAAIHNRFQQHREAWRLRAEIAVQAGGELLELFLSEIIKDLPHIEGVQKGDHPSTPDEVKRLTRAVTPLTRNDLRLALIDRSKDTSSFGTRRIQARFRASQTAVASPTQINEGPTMPELPAENWSVYAVDWRARQWIMVDVPYSILLNTSVFAYADQYNIAGATKRIPWSTLTNTTDIPPRKIIPIFSIGRCGSTLLGRLFTAANCNVLFELDAFTHLGLAADLFPQDGEPRSGIAGLTRELTSHLAEQTSGDDTLVLKMRSQATSLATFFDQQNTDQVIFLVRNLEDWYQSAARAFPELTGSLASQLVAHFEAINRAIDQGLQVQMVSYENILADPVSQMTTILGYSPNENAISEIMSVDAQADTAVSKANLKNTVMENGGYGEFMEEWLGSVDKLRLERLGLDRELRLLSATNLRQVETSAELSNKT
jgi:glycosyltransferase involved in cell wall biosynthesis